MTSEHTNVCDSCSECPEFCDYPDSIEKTECIENTEYADIVDYPDVEVESPKRLYRTNNIIVSLYLVLMFSVFEYFLTNYYGSARRDKFWFFVVLTAIIAIVILCVKIGSKLTKSSDNDNYLFTEHFSIHLADIGMVLFFVATLVSTIFSISNGGDFISCFIGNQGRNMGLLMILMLTIAYFMVSRNFYVSRYVFVLLMVGMGIMSFIAIVNYYYFDPLGIFKLYANKPNVIKDFTSTIGNKNFLSAMICIALPLSVGVSLVTKSKFTLLCTYLSIIVQFAALIVGTSDSGFLGCFFAFAIMLIVVSKNLKQLSRLFTCFTMIIISSKLLWLFDVIMEGNNKGYTSFSEVFVYEEWLFVLIPVFAIIASVLSITNDEDGKIGRAIYIASIVLVCLIILISSILFVYYSVINTEVEVNSFTSFFRFDDDWGTHRGFFWKRSIMVFEAMDFGEKMFGTGPESFRKAFSFFNYELRHTYGESYTTAAHCVYLNYLVTVGMFGLLSYLLFIGATLYNGFKLAARNPLALACLCPIIAYVAQDIVNIASPVDTPWFFIVIAMLQSARLCGNNKERCEETI